MAPCLLKHLLASSAKEPLRRTHPCWGPLRVQGPKQKIYVSKTIMTIIPNKESLHTSYLGPLDPRDIDSHLTPP